MATHVVELGQAARQLTNLVREAGQGGEVLLTEDGRPVARLVAVSESVPARQPGSAKGLFTVPDDFNAPLEDFRDYM
jgi:prevent-host-death family protein